MINECVTNLVKRLKTSRLNFVVNRLTTIRIGLVISHSLQAEWINQPNRCLIFMKDFYGERFIFHYYY